VIATVPSATLLGVRGRAVSVEVHVSNGLPGFTIVGLPDASCREARDRVRAALLSSGLSWPMKRVTVNLAPSGLRKAGSQLDLAIAIALLVAEEVVRPSHVEGFGFLGELGLDGTIRQVTGTVPLVAALSCATAVVAAGSVPEAELVGRHRVRAATNLSELVPALRGDEPWPPASARPVPPPAPPEPDLADVRGQPLARLALELAAAGGHHLLMVGAPGAGKTMLARRLPGLLPDLSPDEALDATIVHSAAGIPLREGLVTRPPFRAPHHGASTVSLTGGGSVAMRPGELSLAHHGVLFLDELGEFQASVIDALRQPLEEGVIRVSRAAGTVSFPARLLLVAAMNPCPCGLGGTPGRCSCSEAARLRYHRRVSGPILDRFDLRLDVAAPDVDDLLSGPPGEATAVVRQRVEQARARARQRGVAANADLPPDTLDQVAPLDGDASSLLENSLRAGRLTGRGLHRVRRLSLTIADCAGHEGPLGLEQVALALQLRSVPVPFEQGAVA
jgi:magnesium chelatase family protein